MNNIITIAKNTFKETIRDRILYAILAFAFLFILSTIFLGSISLGQDLKIIRDLGLAGIYIFSLIIAIFLGTSLIYKEIERRTLYIVLSKPVSSAQFIIGKFLGLFISVFLTISIMTGLYLIIVAAKGGGLDIFGLAAIGMQLFEIMIFIALSILFSTFVAPLASTLYSIIILFIGHSLPMILKYALNSGGSFKYFSYFIYYLLPNLEKFNLRNAAVHNILPSSIEIGSSIIYGIAYTIILLALANYSLSKQEI